MKKLKEKDWKEFLIADIVESQNSKAYHSNELSFTKNKGIAYITRTGKENGLTGIVDDTKGNYVINPAMTISYGAETAEFFLQPASYITGNKMYYMQLSDELKPAALFLISELRHSIKNCFGYANGAIPERVMRKSILLPVNDAGQMDCDYMSNYIYEHRKAMLEKYKSFVNKQLLAFEYKEIPALDDKEWGTFILDDLFIINSGTRLETRNKKPGTRPFIGAADNNNGVTGFVSNKNASYDYNVLGVNYNGNGMCIGFYHPYECIFSDDVKRFHLKNYKDNKYVLLFFKMIILQQKSKFGYLYKFNAERMAKQRLLVPLNGTGEPDYKYMEQYIKNMMLEKYQQYLTFLETRGMN